MYLGKQIWILYGLFIVVCAALYPACAENTNDPDQIKSVPRCTNPSVLETCGCASFIPSISNTFGVYWNVTNVLIHQENVPPSTGLYQIIAHSWVIFSFTASMQSFKWNAVLLSEQDKLMSLLLHMGYCTWATAHGLLYCGSDGRTRELLFLKIMLQNLVY